MGISVKHAGNVTPSAYGAYGAGQGKRYAEDARLALQRIEAEKTRRRQAGSQYTALKAREVEAEKSRAFAVEQGDTAYARGLEQTELAQGYREESAAGDFARSIAGMEFAQGQREQSAEDAFARAQEAKQGEGRDFEVGYSDKQREEVNALADAYDAAVASGEYSEDELKDIRDQMQAKRLGIKPQPRMKQKTPFVTGQGVGDTWTSDTGVLLTRDDKGNVKKLGEAAGQPTVSDITSLYAQAYKTLSPDGLTTPDPKDVEDYVKGALELHKKAMAGFEEAPVAPAVPAGPTSQESLISHVISPAKSTIDYSKLSEEELSGEINAAAERAGVSPDVVRAIVEKDRGE